MTTLELPVDDRWLVSSGYSRDQLRQELKEVLAAKLFELGRLTLAQAASFAGLPAWTFIETLSRLNVSVVNLTEDQLADDLAQS